MVWKAHFAADDDNEFCMLHSFCSLQHQQQQWRWQQKKTGWIAQNQLT